MLPFVRKFCCIFLFYFFVQPAFAQNVAYVNEKAIGAKEFMWIFKKNHPNVANASYQDLADYLKLYTHFKLKVAEAKALGLDTDTAYKKEINGYEKALKAQKKISPKSITFNYIMNEYREGVLMFAISEQKIWSKTQNNDGQLLDFYQKNKSIYNNRDFSEVRGQVSSDYELFLEDQWIKSLTSKYTIKVNEEELRKLARP